MTLKGKRSMSGFTVGAATQQREPAKERKEKA